ncbi:MAG: tetratricopeptide repeat protein [Chthoniobacterales bacterium]
MPATCSSNLKCFGAALVLLAGAVAASAQDRAPGQDAAPAPSAGPSPAAAESSVALVSEAWAAFERKDYPAARAAIARCQSLYGAQAAEMQGKLTALPDKENAHGQWALNDVGTCTFVLGRVAEAEGKKDEAMAAYRMVVDQYSFSQCWDQQGWFWQPAVASQERIAAITLDAE